MAQNYLRAIGVLRPTNLMSGGIMTGKPRLLLIIFLLIVSVAATARAEKIRTSIPGANLNYLSRL